MSFNLSRRSNVKTGIEMSDFCRVAKKVKVGVAEIRTVDEIESAGSGFLTTSNRPKILFEGHYFYRFLSKIGLAEKAHRDEPSVCYPNWTTKHYVGREGEYARIAKATELCHRFEISDSYALKSASWGRYQIMGANFRNAGFDSVFDFVEAMFADEDNHLESFGEYILNTFLDDELRNHQWARFASGYNGSGYRRNKYDIKLANAFSKFSKIKVNCESRAQVVEDLKGIRNPMPAPEGFDNTSLDDRYTDLLELVPAEAVSPPENNLIASSTLATTADTLPEQPQQPPPPAEPAPPPEPIGDTPETAPRDKMQLEDVKPFVLKWLSRIWKGVTGFNTTQFAALTGSGLGFGGDYWWIWLVVGGVIFLITIAAALIVSLVLGGIWLNNRREINRAHELTARLKADPNMYNLGLDIEKI